MDYMTYDKKGNWAKVKESTRLSAINNGKRKESDFIPLDQFTEEMKAIDPKEYLASPAPAEVDPGNVFRRDLEAKQSALDIVSPLYAGDMDSLITSVIQGKKPKDMSTSQQDIYSLVYNIMSSPSAEVLADRLANEESRYGDYVRRVLSRKNLYRTEDGASREPTLTETILPNLSERKASGLGSKALGAFQDITTLPTRALTAGILKATPADESLSFAQNMARPESKSTGAENLADFGISSMVSGGILGKGISALGKLGKAEKFADVVRDVGGATTVGPLKAIGKDVLKGVGEGVQYSVVPAAIQATSPGRESPLGTFAENVGLSALTGGVLGAGAGGLKIAGANVPGVARYLPEELTPYGKELSSQGATVDRLLSSVKREPVQSPSSIIKGYTDVLDETELGIARGIEQSRKKAVEGIESVEGSGVVEDVLLNPYQSNIELNRYLETLPVDVTDFAGKEWSRAYSNVKKTGDIVKEVQRLAKLSKSISDPVKQKVYNDISDNLVEKASLLSDVIVPYTTGSSESLPGVLAKYRSAREAVDELPSPENIMNVGASRLSVAKKPDFEKYLEAESNLNAIRRDFGMEPVDILSAPVASYVRQTPVKTASIDDLVRGVQESGRGTLGSAANLAKTLVAPTIKSQAKLRGVGSIPGSEDTPLVVDAVPGTTAQLLVQGGSVPVVLPAPTKKYTSVEDMFQQTKKEKK